jgi:hypothetical protein
LLKSICHCDRVRFCQSSRRWGCCWFLCLYVEFGVGGWVCTLGRAGSLLLFHCFLYLGARGFSGAGPYSTKRRCISRDLTDFCMTFVSICVDFHGLRFQGKRVGGVGVLSDRVLRDAFVSICVDFQTMVSRDSGQWHTLTCLICYTFPSSESVTTRFRHFTFRESFL